MGAALSPVRPAPGPTRSRLLVRRVTSTVFVVTLIVATFLSMRPVWQGNGHTSLGLAQGYPPERVPVTHRAVPGTSPVAPAANTIRARRQVGSFAKLKGLLPRGAIRPVTGGWLLTQPLGIAGPAQLVVKGGGSLAIAPGAYIEAIQGGTVQLEGIQIAGVDTSGQPILQADGPRGFVMANGGRLILRNDTISNLGYRWDLSFGISFRKSLPGSALEGCTIDGNYRGVYTTQAKGVRIVGNTISRSLEYGVDPHTDSIGLVIQDNRIVDSAVHGVILAVGVKQSRIVGNLVDGAGDHGIVLFDHSDQNVVLSNTIQGTDDGIVVTDSSGSQIRDNTVKGAIRFGIRINGASRDNVVSHNTFSRALLGAWVYGGATANVLMDNFFISNVVDLRIRKDAPDNRASPLPPRSEVQA